MAGSPPVFELFEWICTELATGGATQVITEDKIDVGLFEDVKESLGETSDAAAFKKAIGVIAQHFSQHSGRVPYDFDEATRTFTVKDLDYVAFIAFAKGSRSVVAKARDFEIKTLHRLRKRLTGDLRRVGSPRTKRKKRVELATYLQGFGFRPDCLEPKDKDGGLDILWLPPLGAVPVRSVISVQCKNSFVDEPDANESSARVQKTFNRHLHHGSNNLKFMVFNDYIDEKVAKRLLSCAFLPLGLTDLAEVGQQGLDDIL